MEDEQDLARYYQAHKDDEDLWDEPEATAAPPRARGTLGATVTVRFSAEEAEAIRARAKITGATYSEVVRAAVSYFLHPRVTIQQGMANQLIVVQPGYAPRPQLTGSLAKLMTKR